MASIDKTPAGRWRARWRTPDGRSRSQTFRRKVDAQHHLAGVDHDMLSGRYVDPRAGRVTFAEYAAAWQSAQVHRASTASKVDGDLRRHVLPTFGARPLAGIRRGEVQAWVRELSETLAPASVAVVVAYTRTILRAAVADRLITSSPATGVKVPRLERSQVHPLPTEAVERLIDAVPEHYRALIITAAGTGLRQGELFGLTWSRVDLERRQLRVDRQLVVRAGVAPSLGPPKTDAAHRTVPLPNVVVEALRNPLREADFVFPSHTGGPVRRSRFRDAVWLPAVTEAGIPGATFHDLRHYYASVLIRAGESVKVVQLRLGHASAALTLDVYGHLFPDSDDRTREAIDAVMQS